MTITILVHGGAGDWEIPSNRLTIGVEACQQAAEAGYAILKAGGSALDAVETAVHILEDCPALDAGRGSYPNANGDVQMDALIMDGSNLDMGAIASVTRLRHPITLARRVMTDTPHNFLVGDGAEAFADQIGMERIDQSWLLVPEEALEAGPLGDTVGAVAIDSRGNLASATSTGGTRDKMPGRVGDSPQVGSGGYADNRTAAVSATGQGEAIMKVVMSKQVCDLIAQGMSIQQACDAAIFTLADRTQGTGGLIAVDFRGRIGFAYNTDAMPYAHMSDDTCHAGH